MTNALLNVYGLKKYFPVTAGILRHEIGSVKALNGVSFSIQPGEVLGLVGESGSGKSTVARAVIRLITPTEGQILFQGRDIFTLTPEELVLFRRKVQIIFQNPYASLNPRKKVRESIGEALFYHGMVHSLEEQNDRVAAILEQIGMHPDIMNRYPHQLSGGQQQRVCIGRAIALDPILIVCDEALSALDVSVQAQMLNLLMELREKLGLSYLFISHDLSVVKYICDRVVVLYLGKVMESAPTEELFRNPKHPYTQALLSAVPKLHPGEKKQRILLTGEIPSAMHPPSGCPFRTRCLFAQPICAESPPKKIRGDHEYNCIL